MKDNREGKGRKEKGKKEVEKRKERERKDGIRKIKGEVRVREKKEITKQEGSRRRRTSNDLAGLPSFHQSLLYLYLYSTSAIRLMKEK